MPKVINKTAGQMLRLADVEESVGFKRNKIYRMMAAGTFPKQKKFGSGSIWWETQIDYFIEHQNWDEEDWMQWLSEKQQNEKAA